MENYEEFFHHITKYNPYPYQIQVANAILEGKNIILRAPTGSGKTFAVTIPYLYSYYNHAKIADKLIYSVPLRSLTVGIYNQIKDHAPDCIYHDGNHNSDPFFEHNIIITTIDQTLSAYLGFPYGVESRSKWNITRGAFVGSLMVFDEFHLYELSRLGITTLDLIHRLSNASQWIIMSATLSDEAMKILGNLPNAICIDLSNSELSLVNKNRTKRISCHSDPMSPSEIIAHNGRTIVICNTVDRSIAIYDALISERNNKHTNHRIILLHSRFLDTDRNAKDRDIMQIFGRDGDSDCNAILVATQTIEAGLDITCKYMYTDIAPLNSIIQRIGRCARFENEEGWIYIHDVIDKDGKRYILPYADDLEIINNTWNDIHLCPIITSFNQERNMLNKIYSISDAKAFSSAIASIPIDDITNNVLFKHDNSKQSKYIRNILTTNVSIIDPTDNYKIFHKTISIAPYIIKNKLKKLNPKYPIGYIRKWNDVKEEYEYENITSLNIFDIYPYYVILFNTIASYDLDYGLEIGSPRHNSTPIEVQKKKIDDPYYYPCELYEKHAMEVSIYAQKLTNDTIAFQKICKLHSTNPDILANAVDYMTKLHDIGKLNLACQKHFHIQQQKNDPYNPNYDPKKYYAHSTFDSSKHEKTQNPVGHSYQGAYLSRYIFPDSIPRDIRVIMSYAIAKHHSANPEFDTKRIDDITLSPLKIKSIYTSIGLPNINLKEIYSKYDVREVDELGKTHYRNIQSKYFALSIFFQRVLRLSDWHALDYAKKGA